MKESSKQKSKKALAIKIIVIVLESLPAALLSLIYMYGLALASGKVNIFQWKFELGGLVAFLLFRPGHYCLKKYGFKWPGLVYPAAIVILILSGPLFMDPKSLSGPSINASPGSSAPSTVNGLDIKKYLVKLDYEVREAFIFHVNHSLKRKIDVPAACTMHLGMGVERQKSAGPLRLTVLIREAPDMTPRKVATEMIDRQRSHWKDVEIDLSEHAGSDRTIIIQITTTGEKPEAGNIYLSDVRFESGREVDGPAKKPNIVLIVIDTLRPDHLNSYGYGLRTTDPFFKGLWKNQGVKFETAVSPSSWTLPAVASIMTSMHPSEHGSGVQHFKYGKLDPQLDTLPEILSRQGYDTAAFSVSFIITQQFNFQQGFDSFFDLSPYCFSWQGDKVAAEHAKKWISQKRERPFFIFFHLMNPHSPYSVGPHLEHSSEEVTRAILADDFMRSQVFNYFSALRLPSPHENRKKHAKSPLLKNYDNEIKRTNDAMEEFFAALAYNGLLDNTLIIMTADHGEEFKDHGGMGHGHNLYQEVIHVPIIIAGTPVKTPGRIVQEMVSTMDIMPTVLETAGVSLPPNKMRGTSLWPLIRKNEYNARPFYSELEFADPDKIMMSVIKDNHKLIKTWDNGKEDVRLFDLNADPHEKNNLAPDKTDVVDELSPLLDDMLEKRKRYIQKARESHMPRENREMLKALGYVD